MARFSLFRRLLAVGRIDPAVSAAVEAIDTFRQAAAAAQAAADVQG